MDSLAQIFVVGICVLGVYRLFELFARKKERMAIIERLGEQIKLSDANVNLNLPIFQQTLNGNWALKISLLLIGIGIGLLVGFGFESQAINGNWAQYVNDWHFQSKIVVVYFASVAIFGGIGLLAAYFIEQRHKKI